MAALLVSGTSARKDDSDDYGEEEEMEYEDHEYQEEEDHQPRRSKSKGSHKSNDNNNLLGGLDSSKYDLSVLLHPKGKAMAALLVSDTSARKNDCDDYGEEEEEEYEDHEFQEDDHQPRRRKSKGSHKSNHNNLLGGLDSSKYDVSVLLHPKGKAGPGMQAEQMLHELAAEKPAPSAVEPAPQAPPPPQAIYPAVQQYGRSQGSQELSSRLGTLLACGLGILVLAAVAIGMLYFQKFQKKDKKGSKYSMGSSIIGSQTSPMADRKGSRLGSKTSNNPKGSRKGSRATSKGSAIDSPYSASKSGPFKLTLVDSIFYNGWIWCLIGQSILIKCVDASNSTSNSTTNSTMRNSSLHKYSNTSIALFVLLGLLIGSFITALLFVFGYDMWRAIRKCCRGKRVLAAGGAAADDYDDDGFGGDSQIRCQACGSSLTIGSCESNCGLCASNSSGGSSSSSSTGATSSGGTSSTANPSTNANIPPAGGNRPKDAPNRVPPPVPSVSPDVPKSAIRPMKGQFK